LREYNERKAAYDFAIKRETKRFELDVRRESGNIKLDNKIYAYKMVTEIWDTKEKELMALVTDDKEREAFKTEVDTFKADLKQF
jgi:hypothetical protein